MKPGDVVPMTSCRAKQAGSSYVEGYKAPKGEHFLFIFLGRESQSKPMDIEATLNKMGWVKKDATRARREGE